MLVKLIKYPALVSTQRRRDVMTSRRRRSDVVTTLCVSWAFVVFTADSSNALVLCGALWRFIVVFDGFCLVLWSSPWGRASWLRSLRLFVTCVLSVVSSLLILSVSLVDYVLWLCLFLDSFCFCTLKLNTTYRKPLMTLTPIYRGWFEFPSS